MHTTCMLLTQMASLTTRVMAFRVNAAKPTARCSINIPSRWPASENGKKRGRPKAPSKRQQEENRRLYVDHLAMKVDVEPFDFDLALHAQANKSINNFKNDERPDGAIQECGCDVVELDQHL